jgi:hypothetical protein
MVSLLYLFVLFTKIKKNWAAVVLISRLRSRGLLLHTIDYYKEYKLLTLRHWLNRNKRNNNHHDLNKNFTKKNSMWFGPSSII